MSACYPLMRVTRFTGKKKVMSSSDLGMTFAYQAGIPDFPPPIPN